MPHSEPLQSFRPYDGTLLWEGDTATERDIQRAVSRGRVAQREWAQVSLAERLAAARAFKAAVEADAEPFAQLIAEETAKPFWEARTEVASVAAKVEHSIAAQAERAGSRESAFGPDATQTLRHRPHGVLAVLGPYNFPAHLPNGHIVPALIAGNAVVFKPSEKTPATGEYMASLWGKAGLPDGLLQTVQGGAEVGKSLAFADVDGLLFTGSARAGAALTTLYAATPWRMLALEMGGNNPIIAWDVADADLEAAARIILQSAFLSAGQRCSCARRLIVEDGRHEALLDALTALTDRILIDQPFADTPPFMGALIDNAAADKLIAEASALGGKTIRPLVRQKDNLPFLTPAIIDVTGLVLPDEEMFGPVLQVIRVPDFGAALAAANDTRFGLSAALVGGDRALFERFASEIRAGVVNWNRPTNGAASNAPFGGIGLSGNHRPSAWYAADYCAWPVAGIEAETPALDIPRGLR